MKFANIVTALLLAASTVTSVKTWATQVLLTTDLGDIVVEVNEQKAPLTSQNFLEYVDSGHYNGTIFHRVIPGFVVQGGGFLFDFTEKATREPITNESNNGLSNTFGTIAMARTGDPHSATSQFYFNLKDNSRLDGSEDKFGYTVFGTVVNGMDVLQAITKEPQGLYRRYPNAPNAPVRILTAQRIDSPVPTSPSSSVSQQEPVE
jgi:cyclophilin family peptidyl-prolyl cis-trans isomerase